MLFTDPVYVGIDPTSAHKPFSYAAVDRGLNLLALGEGELDDVLAFLAGQSTAVVAINAPSGLNRGLVRERKRELFKTMKSRASGFRVSELELRERGIAVTGTPSSLGTCPAWMQAGLALYRKLENMGFKAYPAEDARYQILETQPYACFCVMAGHIPQSKLTVEGKIQRQLILYERGLRIKDPMEFFEEITRHKMIKGQWPYELLYQPEQLDALVAAYTAWFSIHKADQVTMVGDIHEGLIVLPEKNLKEKY